jgi:serine/threonine protein kinase
MLTAHAEPTTRLLAAPNPAAPTTPPANARGRRHRILATVIPWRRSRPADRTTTTATPPRRPDNDRQHPDGTEPLRVTDPVLVDGYRLVSRLGTGGMANVFYALSPGGLPVAVKVLHAVPRARRACRREYQLASAVDARCTAPVLDHGVSAAGAYLVTTYLPGYRGATTLGRGTMPVERLWTFGSGLARALASIHGRGIVHCDVKPANLLVRDDDVRVIDFGIARYIGERSELQGSVQCSRGWAAPEQLRDEPATPAVDIFAWGCVLAYLACGVHPFASRDEHEWILRVQSAEPDLARLPAALDGVIRATLARNPQDRPNARDLAGMCGLTSRRSVPSLDRGHGRLLNRASYQALNEDTHKGPDPGRAELAEGASHPILKVRPGNLLTRIPPAEPVDDLGDLPVLRTLHLRRVRGRGAGRGYRRYLGLGGGLLRKLPL